MKFLINNSLSYFIAKRIERGDKISDIDCGNIESNKAARIITRVAMWSIVVSISVMIVAITIVEGFSTEVDNKVKGIISTFQIVRYDNNFSSEKGYIVRNNEIVDKIANISSIETITPFAMKNGVAKNDEEITGILLKGIDDYSRLDFYSKYLISGKLPDIKSSSRVKEMILSSSMAKHLNITSGDYLELMFMERPPLRERFIVSGIYDTSLSSVDKTLAITDLRNVQDILNWSSDKIGGYDVVMKEGSDVNLSYEEVAGIVDSRTYTGEEVMPMVTTVRDKFPHIYSWLDLQKSNEFVIITIMLIVAIINIISMVLIILLQKLYLIGLLMVLGMRSLNIRRILIYRSMIIVIKGLIVGNIIAISMLFLQKHYEIIKLDPAGYFLTSVPVSFDWNKIIFINLAVIFVMLLFQWIATYLISKLPPSTIVKYEKR